MQGVAGDFGALVAGGDEQGDDGDAAGESGEVQRGVGFVGEVWVGEEGGVQADEAGDEDGVVEVDGAAEAGGGVDPGGRIVRRGVQEWGGGYLHFGSMLLLGLLQLLCCSMVWCS